MLTSLKPHTNIIWVEKRPEPLTQRFTNYLMMEMEHGLESLKNYRKRAQMTEVQCAQVMKGVFKALKHLHDEENVIHRDIKPDNIIITDYEDLTKVKLIDFGLAVKSNQYELQDFARCGTVLYTPPEQVLRDYAYAKVSCLSLTEVLES